MGMHNTKITKYKQLKNKNYEASTPIRDKIAISCM